jgi:hypothetical protein
VYLHPHFEAGSLASFHPFRKNIPESSWFLKSTGSLFRHFSPTDGPIPENPLGKAPQL